MSNLCVFDIETIPDIAGFKRLNAGLGSDLLPTDDKLDSKADFSEADWSAYMAQQRRGEVGHDFMRHHLHRVVAISVLMIVDGKLKCASVGEPEDDEATLIERFFHLIEAYHPTLVSWNGSGFDLPVLHYRALFHGIAAPRYWDVGHFDNQMKWANYQSRFQYLHMDLMDILSGFQARATASLNEVCKLAGFPGKLATDGAAVLSLYQAGDLQAIRDYCETDVLNTYLLYLRFEKIRGILNAGDYETRLQQLTQYLQNQNKSHFSEFLAAWQRADQRDPNNT